MPTWMPSQVGRARSWPRRDQGCQTLCMWVDTSRQMAGNRTRFPLICPSINCPSLWKNVRLRPYLILVKVWKGRSQPHKSTRLGKDSKPLPWCFHSNKKRIINLTKAGAAEQGDFLISVGPHLLGISYVLFFPTLRPSETNFRQLHTSMLDIYKMFEALVCCLKGIWVLPYYITLARPAPDLGTQGHLWSENDAILSWIWEVNAITTCLKLISTSDCFILPY